MFHFYHLQRNIILLYHITSHTNTEDTYPGAHTYQVVNLLNGLLRLWYPSFCHISHKPNIVYPSSVTIILPPKYTLAGHPHLVQVIQPGSEGSISVQTNEWPQAAQTYVLIHTGIVIISKNIRHSQRSPIRQRCRNFVPTITAEVFWVVSKWFVNVNE